MEIQKSNSIYSNYATMFQTQKTNSKTGQDDSANSTNTASRFDRVEISDEAYAAYAQSMSQSLSNLVSDGTITSDQADSIESALSSSSVDASDGSNPLKTVLDSLVSNDVISEDQEEAISKEMAPPPPPPAPPEMDNSNDGSPDDYLSDLLDSLVSDGTITSDQADSIESALSSSSVDVSDGSNPLKTVLGSLVSNNVISEDQEKAIAELMAPPSDLSGITTD